ncbi:alpha/beta fold hydrolase [Streptacidiphilus sp. N1-3]|uniref:Alpha/beta fold hydrolase n=1 Tax=Streptacidiphilus alkalitolerans TaxID=3342712 RepID=A0ABV6XDN4_9ACTN
MASPPSPTLTGASSWPPVPRRHRGPQRHRQLQTGRLPGHPLRPPAPGDDRQSGRTLAVAADSFYLQGFSGGGQFALRFLYLHPDRLAGVSIGAPGRVTLLDATAEWPHGTSDLPARFGAEARPESLSTIPIQLLIGELDCQPHPLTPLNGTESILLLRDNLLTHGISPVLDIVPGAAHSGYALLPAATAFLARLVPREEDFTTRSAGRRRAVGDLPGQIPGSAPAPPRRPRAASDPASSHASPILGDLCEHHSIIGELTNRQLRKPLQKPTRFIWTRTLCTPHADGWLPHLTAHKVGGNHL